MLAPTLEPSVASVFAPRTIIDADGTVEGYASLVGEIDEARDLVVKGVRRIPMLFQHDSAGRAGTAWECGARHA